MQILLSTKEATKIVSDYYSVRLGQNYDELVVSINDDTTMALKLSVIGTIRHMLNNAQKIHAIKYLKVVSGMGLVDSKGIVDELEDGCLDAVVLTKFEIENPAEVSGYKIG